MGPGAIPRSGTPGRWLLEPAPFGNAAALVDAEGRPVWHNRAFEELLGGPMEPAGEAEGLPALRGTPVPAALQEVLRGGAARTLRSVELPAGPDRPARFVDVDLRRLEPPDPAGPRVLALFREVSEQIAEHERARLFYASFLTSTNAIEVTDARGFLVDVNPAFERIYGYSRRECVGKKPSLVRSRHSDRQVYERMWADLLDPARGHWSGEMVNRDRQGRERPVFLTITAVHNDVGETTHYLGVAVDLTEQRAWQRMAAHSDKLTSLGQLAAGVAHEINTPLANVLLVAESIRRKTDDPWLKQRIATITGQVEAAARIVRGLLDFARRDEPQMAEHDLAQVVRDAVAFVRGKQSYDVEVTEVYPEGPLPVHVDRGGLIQVITNVINNAYEAMDGPGKIRVEVRSRHGRGEVDIVDTGPGIPPEVLPHIFEPFFTTKGEGKGTGLGLAICDAIVQAHRGSITARNVPGAGAGFLIDLPLAEAAPPPSVGRAAGLVKPAS
jgi:PAS domain S-box-containing protein